MSLKSNEPFQSWRLRVMLVALIALVGIYVGRNQIPALSGLTNTEAEVIKTTEGSQGSWHYFRTGLWLADLRTLVAACRFVLEPDPPEVG